MINGEEKRSKGSSRCVRKGAVWCCVVRRCVFGAVMFERGCEGEYDAVCVYVAGAVGCVYEIV